MIRHISRRTSRVEASLEISYCVSCIKVGMNSDDELIMNDIFVSALGLLHSREIDSAEKLKRMLNSLIEKKWTIVSDRRRKRSKHLWDDCESEMFVDSVDQPESRNGSQIEVFHHRPQDARSIDPRRYETDDESTKMCKINLENEDQDENIDVPRISIPEEHSDEVRVVCKICKGDKLGPLILLECQECQETYHPLCHQPAVVEIDVYDPRLVWRCGKCLETSNKANQHFFNKKSPPVVTLDDDDDRDDDVNNETEIFIGDVFRNITTRMTLDRIDNKGTTKVRNSGSRTKPKIQQYSRKLTTKNASVQLRKRVGTKLTVNRLSPP